MFTAKYWSTILGLSFCYCLLIQWSPTFLPYDAVKWESSKWKRSSSFLFHFNSFLETWWVFCQILIWPFCPWSHSKYQNFPRVSLQTIYIEFHKWTNDSLLLSLWPGGAVGSILHPLPCLQGAGLLKRERKVAQVQTLVLKEYLRKYSISRAPEMENKSQNTL